MGYFVAIDGLSGSGKSTALAAVAEALRSEGYTVGVYHDRVGEPNAAKLDEAQHSVNLSPGARLYFNLAMRRQVTDAAIVPSLASNRVTLVDRWHTSSVAYQGHGQGLDLDFVTRTAREATSDAEPDRIIYIDVPAAVALGRMAMRGEVAHVFDDESYAFHSRVREGYLEQARDDERCVIVDGTQPREAVAASIFGIIMHDLAEAIADTETH